MKIFFISFLYILLSINNAYANQLPVALQIPPIIENDKIISEKTYLLHFIEILKNKSVKSKIETIKKQKFSIKIIFKF